MTQFITASEAAKLIKDNMTIGLGGMGLAGWPEEIAVAVAERYKEEGHPRNLTVRQGSDLGDWHGKGITHWGIEGLVRSWNSAHVGSAFDMCKLVRENKIALHCMPQGVVINLWREIAAHRPGLITKIGLGTFADPRVEGACMNEAAKEEESPVELIELSGEEYLFYKSFPVDVAFVRGTAADEDGNISFFKEGFVNEGLAVAEAAHNSGGIVIAQVEYATEKGSLRPKDVRIPGAIVDYVVVATDKEACFQTEGTYYDPALAGNLRKPMKRIPKMPLDPKKIILRRCAMELGKGDLVNLGFGIPADVASVVAEEGQSDEILLSTETGNLGGVPAGIPDFGSSYNAQASIDPGSMFDLYDGGGIDVAVLGLAQADEMGNINVSKFKVPGLGDRMTGPGGFINITQSAKKVIFAGMFTAKSKERIVDGKLVIDEKGNNKKFVKAVEQITFSGKQATENGQKVLYVTERCVFELIDGKMTLTEIAPGVDLEKDILPAMDFKPHISGDLKTMDINIFEEEWGNLKLS